MDQPEAQTPAPTQAEQTGGRRPVVRPAGHRSVATMLREREEAREAAESTDSPPVNQSERTEEPAQAPPPEAVEDASTVAASQQEADTAAELASRTSQSEEQLREAGAEHWSQRARARFEELAVGRNEARAENDKLKEQLALMSAQIGALQAGNQSVTAQNQQTGTAAKPILREYPIADPGEDADEAVRQAWQIGKQTWEAQQEQLQEFGKGLTKVVAPVYQHMAGTEDERSWSSLESAMAEHGTSRAELEPLIKNMRSTDPSRTIRGSAFELMAEMGKLAEGGAQVPTAPPSQVPGAGRTARPSATPRELTPEELWAARQQKAKEMSMAGRRAEASRELAQGLRHLHWHTE